MNSETKRFTMPRMVRRSPVFAILLALVAGFALGGCVIVRETISEVGAATKRDFLRYSGDKSPVLVTALNSPFREGPLSVAAIAAQHAGAAVAGTNVGFTEDASQARRPDFRLVLLFDPVNTISPRDICAAARAAPAAVIGAGELRLHAAFCLDDEPIAGALATGPLPDGPTDPAFEKLVRMTVAEMFPEQDRRGPGKQHYMTSIRFYPKPGFRLNPLTGVFD
jgi:hypothetical protein